MDKKISAQYFICLTIFQRLLTRGVPEELQQWTEINSVNSLRSYTTNLDVPLEDIQRYVEYRNAGPTVEREQPPEPATEVRSST